MGKQMKPELQEELITHVKHEMSEGRHVIVVTYDDNTPPKIMMTEPQAIVGIGVLAWVVSNAGNGYTQYNYDPTTESYNKQGDDNGQPH